MNRRELFKIGVTAAAAPAALAAQAVAAPQATAAKADWKPLLFDAHQNETVVALSELIIPATDTPGAKAAQVNRHMDLLLHDGPAAQREAFLAGLSWLDGYTLRRHRQPFVRCTPAQQTAILQILDENREEGVKPGHDFFQTAKSLTSRIYYATEIGFKELNKGGRVPSSYVHPCKEV